MCSRFSLTSPLEALRQLFNFSERPNLTLAYNIAPTNRIAAIRLGDIEKPNKKQFFMAQWGLIPSWEKTPENSANLINARSETVSQKPSFRKAFQKRRCLIPCNGFYEWKKQNDDSKQPYYVYSTDTEIIAFAGLWEQWTGPNREVIESCTILTRPAVGVLADIHHRMPVTIKPQLFDQWLWGKTEASIPPPDQQTALIYHPVHKKVGNVKNNDTDLRRKIELPSAPIQASLF